MTTTCQLPLRLNKELYEKIRAEAKARGVSMNAFVRERLEGQIEAIPVSQDVVKAVLKSLLESDADIIEALKARSKALA